MKFFACVAACGLLAGPAHAAVNLVVNGDFESGDTGFTSDHTYVSPGASALYPEGLYTIAANPISVHPFWIDIPDGSDMLIVNGKTGGLEPVVWQQAIDLAPGAYDFSAQAANICCNSSFSGPNASSNLLFQYSFDGLNFADLASIVTAPPGDAGLFYSVNGQIHTDTAQTVTLRVSNGVTAASGNDFALDNIMLSMVPEPATWSLMIAGFGLAGLALRRKRGVAVVRGGAPT